MSNYNTNTLIHIRRYFVESDKTFPTRYGVTLSKQEILDLLGLSNVILTEYERLEAQTAAKKKNAAKVITDVPAVRETVSELKPADEPEIKFSNIPEIKTDVPEIKTQFPEISNEDTVSFATMFSPMNTLANNPVPYTTQSLFDEDAVPYDTTANYPTFTDALQYQQWPYEHSWLIYPTETPAEQSMPVSDVKQVSDKEWIPPPTIPVSDVKQVSDEQLMPPPAAPNLNQSATC